MEKDEEWMEFDRKYFKRKKRHNYRIRPAHPSEFRSNPESKIVSGDAFEVIKYMAQSAVWNEQIWDDCPRDCLVYSLVVRLEVGRTRFPVYITSGDKPELESQEYLEGMAKSIAEQVIPRGHKLHTIMPWNTPPQKKE